MTTTGTLPLEPGATRRADARPSATGSERASALYEGVVRHRRFVPTSHRFHHRGAMALLDIDELDGLIDSLPLWSSRRWAPVRYRRVPCSCR